MATDHLSVTVDGLVQTLRTASELRDVLTGVFPYYAYDHAGYFSELGKMAISVLVGASQGEEFIHNESLQTDFLPTEITLVCDTKLSDDSEAFVSEDGYSLLDLEYLVIRALQSDAWWDAEGSNNGWVIAGIERDVAIPMDNGEPDPDYRRFEITLLVDVLLDRTDGPAR